MLPALSFSQQAVATSATLWFAGDYLAQQLAMVTAAGSSKGVTNGDHDKPCAADAGSSAASVPADAAAAATAAGGRHGSGAAPPTSLDTKRLLFTTLEGSLVGGALGSYWYRLLDRLVTRTGFAAGSARFVAAKLALEVGLWHVRAVPCRAVRTWWWFAVCGKTALCECARMPVRVPLQPFSLCAFWLFMGFANGDSFDKISAELSSEFLPTLASGAARVFCARLRLGPEPHVVLFRTGACPGAFWLVTRFVVLGAHPLTPSLDPTP